MVADPLQAFTVAVEQSERVRERVRPTLFDRTESHDRAVAPVWLVMIGVLLTTLLLAVLVVAFRAI